MLDGKVDSCPGKGLSRGKLCTLTSGHPNGSEGVEAEAGPKAEDSGVGGVIRPSIQVIC